MFIAFYFRFIFPFGFFFRFFFSLGPIYTRTALRTTPCDRRAGEQTDAGSREPFPHLLAPLTESRSIRGTSFVSLFILLEIAVDRCVRGGKRIIIHTRTYERDNEKGRIEGAPSSFRVSFCERKDPLNKIEKRALPSREVNKGCVHSAHTLPAVLDGRVYSLWREERMRRRRKEGEWYAVSKEEQGGRMVVVGGR